MRRHQTDCREYGTFESLACVQVDLLCLSNLFQDLLDDHPIVIPHFTEGALQSNLISTSAKQRKCRPRRELNMEVALHDIDVELPP